MTFAWEQMCGVERPSSKRRWDDRFSSRSQSSLGVPLKPGYRCCGLQVRDISSPADFMQVLIFQRANMLGWFIAGSRALAWRSPLTARTQCGVRRSRRFIARPVIFALFNCSSEGRHTAREQQVEARITYRFHPRLGEIVRVRRRLERGGAAFLVVHQLDGTFSCLPAWMTDDVNKRPRVTPPPQIGSIA
jgi:hypothetical protein